MFSKSLSTPVSNHVHRQVRSYVHNTRYQGYVNKFPANPDGTFGFIIRYNRPSKEYIFSVDDVRFESTPKLRRYQRVEFEISPGIPFQRAIRITAPSHKLLQYTQHNASLPEHGRTYRLSDTLVASNGNDKGVNTNTRFTGIVSSINMEQHHGMIIPDLLHSDSVYFECTEIQSTGIAALKPNDAVSFSVIKSSRAGPQSHNDQRKDVALCILRPDGGLITAEDGNSGSRRRKLGTLYNAEDAMANIPDEFARDRIRGFIIHRHHNGLVGYIMPFDDDDNKLIPLHIDDCHFYGNRKLRRFQEVEFALSHYDGFIEDRDDFEHLKKKQSTKLQDELKAVHVTLPGGLVMRYNEENHYRTTPKMTRFGPEEHSPNDRHQGIITKISPNEWSCSASDVYEITPNLKGYRSVIGYESELRVVGNKALQIGDAVEFHVDFTNQRAFHITAQGGYPFVCEYSDNEYSRYLRSKCSLSTLRKEFMEFKGGRNGSGYGYISWFNQQTQCGTIEIIAEDKECRYKQILFHIKDVKMAKFGEVMNQKVEFMVKAMGRIDGTNNAEFQPFLWRNDLDLSQKAVDVRMYDVRSKWKKQQKIKMKAEVKDVKSVKEESRKENIPSKLISIQKLVHQRMTHLRY